MATAAIATIISGNNTSSDSLIILHMLGSGSTHAHIRHSYNFSQSVHGNTSEGLCGPVSFIMGRKYKRDEIKSMVMTAVITAFMDLFLSPSMCFEKRWNIRNDAPAPEQKKVLVPPDSFF